MGTARNNRQHNPYSRYIAIQYNTTLDKLQQRPCLNFGQILNSQKHYRDVIMSTMASQITCLTIVYPTVYWDADQRKHQSSVSLAESPVNSPHKWPVTRKMFPFDDVIMRHHMARGPWGSAVCEVYMDGVFFPSSLRKVTVINLECITMTKSYQLIQIDQSWVFISDNS